jgi:hypothetical protein
VQDDGPHVVPELAGVQVPNPSHPIEHLVGSLFGQAVVGPAGPGAQVPRLPLLLQIWQVAHELVLQQTPSTQLPIAQSFADGVQVWPRGFPTQVPPLQMGFVEGQSPLVQHALARMQAPLHAL